MLPLLPILATLPKAISTIARIVGPKKGNKLKDAADAISEFTADVKSSRIPPEQMAELQKALAQQEVKMRELALEESKDARALIREEGRSDDPWVRRARPMFLWLIYVVLFWNFVVLGTWQFFKTGVPVIQAPINFPQELYYLFGTAFVGYTGARSWDKKNGGKGLLKGLLK